MIYDYLLKGIDHIMLQRNGVLKLKPPIHMKEYAVLMYKQYENDVAKVNVALNLYQLKTLQLLEFNFRNKKPTKLAWYKKLMSAFKNRRN